MQRSEQEVVADVVVVGGGIAGFVTGLAAVEQGLSVVLFEKQAEIGGSTVLSGGFFAFAGTDEQAAAEVVDSTELFREDLLACGAGFAREDLVDAYLENQHDTYRWLSSIGVRFEALEQSSGQSVARSHHAKIRPALALLRDRFVGDGGTLLLETTMVELTTDGGGRVDGLRARNGDRAVRARARRGVVLATGGMTRARDLLAAYVPEQLAALPYGGLGNTGDGIRAATALGAGLADMQFISGTFGSHPETTLESHELLTVYYMGAIIVNQRGERFVDESITYKELGRAVLAQPDGMGFSVFDARVRARSRPGVPLADIDAIEARGHVHRASTLEELADLCGIDQSALIRTVESYNAAARGERPDGLGRSHLCNGVGALAEIVEPPFYAYPAKTLLTTTFGGVTVSANCRVETGAGRPIDGLFAVGEVVGGFHGANYMTGTSLGKGAVFGRVAARALTGAVV